MRFEVWITSANGHEWEEEITVIDVAQTCASVQTCVTVPPLKKSFGRRAYNSIWRDEKLYVSLLNDLQSVKVSGLHDQT